MLVYVIAGSSLTVLSGFAGQVSFGSWALVGFGALFGWLARDESGMAPLPACILTVCAGTTVGLAVALPALRIRGLFLGVTTLAFAVACSSYFFTLAPFQLVGLAERSRVLGVDLDSETTYYYLCVVAAGGALLLVRNLRGGRWGRNFLAVRDNDRAAASYGVDPVTTKLAAFAASGFLASLAGFLYLYAERSVNARASPCRPRCCCSPPSSSEASAHLGRGDRRRSTCAESSSSRPRCSCSRPASACCSS